MALPTEPGAPAQAGPIVIVDDDVSCLVAVEQILRIADGVGGRLSHFALDAG